MFLSRFHRTQGHSGCLQFDKIHKSVITLLHTNLFIMTEFKYSDAGWRLGSGPKFECNPEILNGIRGI